MTTNIKSGFMSYTPGKVHQRGVTLVIALIMLIAMTLAGLALFRQVGTGVIVARNLTFRENATSIADQGVETARSWLLLQSASTLEQAVVAQGYYAAWCNVSVTGANTPDFNSDGAIDDCATSPPPSTFTASGYNWVNAVHIAGIDGNQVDYVIHRMCAKPGGLNISNQECSTVSSANGNDNHDITDYDHLTLSGSVRPYFRITTRVTGPMNTVVYTQSIIY
jgi:type IV pilus assembly protein PilX